MSLKEIIYFNKKKIIIIVICIVICLIGGCYFYYDKYYVKDENNDSSNKVLISNEVSLEKKEEELEVVMMCYFDIKGEVNKPGVYAIECDKRIIDAINLSGGLTKNSDTSVLNLSKKIEDGMVIIVYSKKEITSYLETLKQQEEKQSICNTSNINNDACLNSNSSSNNSSNLLININTASLSELMTLTGIGEAKAKNIISYRDKTPFKRIEDILNVEGIGESIYVNIKENITV